MQTKHTHDEWYRVGNVIYRRAKREDGFFYATPVAEMIGERLGERERCELADFVARAVNSHAELLEACLAALRDHEERNGGLDLETVEQLRAAIAKAESS